MDKTKLVEKMKAKFDKIELGKVIDEYDYPLSRGRGLLYLEGIDELDNPTYAMTDGDFQIPTTILENDVNYSHAGKGMFALMGPLRVLLAFQESTFLNPLKTGTTITAKSEFADKFIKRGRFYVSMKTTSYDEAGTPLLQNIYTMSCDGAQDMEDTAPTLQDPFDHKLDVPALQAIGGTKATKATADVAEETVIESREKALTMDMSKLYWVFPVDRHFHNDEKVAKSLGFPGPVMGGSQGTAILSEMLHSYFGESWFTSGRMAVKPIVSVHPPENLVARGVVTKKEAEGDKTRVYLDIWLENEKGEAAQVGIASCLVA